MRGFTKKGHRTVTFTRDGETLTLTLHTLPVLFMPMLREMIPIQEEMSASQKSIRVERQGVAMVAEALRPSEELPALPSPRDPAEAWVDYTTTLSDTFRGAGLSVEMIRRLVDETVELINDCLLYTSPSPRD